MTAYRMLFAVAVLAAASLPRADQCARPRPQHMLPSFSMTFADLAYELFAQPHELRSRECKSEDA